MLTKQDVAFRHYREINADGTVNPRGGVTVVFPKERMHDFGFAYCSKSDNFEYEFGRKLALERLNAHIENEGACPSQANPKELLMILDFKMALGFGYNHIIRAKNRRKHNEKA